MAEIGRRQRIRRETITQIKQAALDQIRTKGASELSLREIGRAIGMSAPGLYRYYENRAALLTELIADAYNSLADHVDAAVDARHDRPAVDRLVAGAMAYRAWAVEHSNQFMLIFGTPIPGYQAPAGGPTVDAVLRLATTFGRLQLETAGVEADEGSLRRLLDREQSSDALETMMAQWAHLHGLVTLEVLGHLDWAIKDPAAFLEAEMRSVAIDLRGRRAAGGADTRSPGSGP